VEFEFDFDSMEYNF